MAKLLDFQVLSEKTLHHIADPNLIKYCPSMDLVALVTTDQQVFIYRLNGQRVYGASPKSIDLTVECIQWKPNGQLLAIGWSDGSIRLVGVESSKIVHQFTGAEQTSGITCIGWASNITNRTSNSMNGEGKLRSWLEILGSGSELSGNQVLLDLPRELSMIDVEISLPKLSILASAGSLDDIFCSRSSLDDLLRPFDPKDNNAVDVMVVGTKEGDLHLSIYDSFVIGSFKSPLSFSTADLPCQLILHASHKQCSTHALLMRPTKSENIFFVPMDLRFISASSGYLSLLASRSTALSNLLRYIQQVQILMVAEWKSTQDLPNRFIRNINETLSEKDNCNIIQALYHSVATGHTFPAVREWLVDELSERGHKRWEKAVMTGLENLKRLVHENILPALERCSVILSRFAGIAEFQASNDAIGFTSQQISLIMDTVACLHLISSKILIQVVDELDLFSSFSGWLRYEIDRLASDGSSTPDDATEKEASIDHSKVLLYLQKVMMTSPLALFLDESREESGLNHSEPDLPLFDALNKQLHRQERGISYTKPLLRIDRVCARLIRQAGAVFSQIAEAEKRNVLFGRAQDIGMPAMNSPIEMKMSKAISGCMIHVAFIPKCRPTTIQFTRVALSIESGISTLKQMESSAIELGKGEIKDMKFVDDNILLVLWKCKGRIHFLNIPYDDSSSSLKSHSDGFKLRYSPRNPGSPSHTISFSEEETTRRFAKYKDDVIRETFVPDKIEVRAPKSHGEGDDTRRIVVLSSDRLQYMVLKIMPLKSTKGIEDNVDEDVSMT